MKEIEDKLATLETENSALTQSYDDLHHTYSIMKQERKTLQDIFQNMSPGPINDESNAEDGAEIEIMPSNHLVFDISALCYNSEEECGEAGGIR